LGLNESRVEKKTKQITDDREKLLDKGGFKLKEWTYSEERSSTHDPKIPMDRFTGTEKVLGVVWDYISQIKFFSREKGD